MKVFNRNGKITRVRFWCFWGLIFAVIAIFNVATYAGDYFPPDRIVYNALVYRGQGAWAEGFATSGQVFSAVGTSDQMLALAEKYPNAELIDGEGRLIVPGFNDVHVHAFPLNTFGIPLNDPSEWIPGPGPNKGELLGMLAGAASQVPPGTWLWAFVGNAILDDALHGSKSRITRWDIDEVTPDHPVVVMGWGGHGLLLDSQVMAAIGLGETDPDPWAGWYGRTTKGVNDGWCWEYAEFQAITDIRALIPAEQIAPQLNAVLLGMAKLGVTSIQTMDFLDDSIYKAALDEAGTLARVRIISFPLTYEESLRKSGRSFNPYAKVNVYGVKWVSDGTPIERLTAMEKKYTDWPGWSGIFNFPLDNWQDMVVDGLKIPLVEEQRIFHTIGDRTLGNLVTAMEEAAPSWMWRFHRLRVEHGEFASLYAGQLAAKNVVVAYNPIHHSFPQMFIPRYGERMADMYKMRTVKNAGIKIAIGSDGMGLFIPMTGEGIGGNPFIQIFFAVVNPTNPEEGLTVEEAVDAHTYGSAYAEFMEIYKGTISVGKLADYAILSQNIFDPDLLDLIPATYSVRTVCGGKDTYVFGQ